MFGSKVIGSSPAATPQRSHVHARLANNPHHAASLRRASSFLATPEPGWPTPNGVVGLQKYGGPEAREEKARGGAGEWYTIVHDPSYKQAQLMFLEVLQQADGNRLYDVLAAMPYHVDTHMQVRFLFFSFSLLSLTSSFDAAFRDDGSARRHGFVSPLSRLPYLLSLTLLSLPQAPPQRTLPALSTPSPPRSPLPSPAGPSVSPTRRSRTARCTSAWRGRSTCSSNAGRGGLLSSGRRLGWAWRVRGIRSGCCAGASPLSLSLFSPRLHSKADSIVVKFAQDRLPRSESEPERLVLQAPYLPRRGVPGDEGQQLPRALVCQGVVRAESGGGGEGSAFSPRRSPVLSFILLERPG